MADIKQSHPLIIIFKGILILDIAVAAIAVVIGLFLGWTTTYQYGGGIFIGGILVVTAGVLSVLAYWKKARNFESMPAQSKTHESGIGRNKHTKYGPADGPSQRYASQITLALSGMSCLVIGSILQSI